MRNKIFTFILALVASMMLPVRAQSLIRVDDNSIAEWNNLPANYVAEAVCPEDAAMLGLRSVKVFADPDYINILAEPDMDELPDLEWVPFHVYLDIDNSDATGGYGDLFTDANTDILLETAVFADDQPFSYNPAVFKWWGEVGGYGWEWVDPSVAHDASDNWGAIIGEGQLPFGASQYVDGKIEIQLSRELLGTAHPMNENEFGIGFDIQQNWSSVGILPCASATDENPSGHAAKLHVTIYKEGGNPDAGEAKLWPIIMDETAVAEYQQYIVDDFRPNDESNFLYVWDGTYSGGDASGLNAFGHSDGYVALVVGGSGWSGAGFNLSEAGNSWQNAEALRQAILANPDDFFLHVAIKSTDNASHCFYFMNNEGTKFVLGNQAVYDGPVYQDFERDGKWHELYIPMAQYANALANTTLQAGANVFIMLSEGTQGVQLNLDAVYFCTTAMKDMMPAVVNPDPIDPEPHQPGAPQLWPVMVGETTLNEYVPYIAANFSPNGESNFLYIWEGTYSGGEMSGLNAFGHDDGYMALVVGGAGWSGAGFCLTESGNSWQEAEALRQAIVANPNDYFLHIAIKSTDNASHCFSIMGSDDTKFVLGNHSVYDGPVYQDFERDGKWHEFYIPMAQYANALANTTVQAGVNVLTVLSEGTMGVQLNLDAIYFCTTAMKDMMPAVVNPEPVEPEEIEVAVKYLDKNANVIDHDAVMLLLPEAPEFEGFTFLRWEVVAGNLEDGIKIQAVYEADEQSISSVMVSPSNPAQKLVREGNVYILKGTDVYTMQGLKVK